MDPLKVVYILNVFTYLKVDTLLNVLLLLIVSI